MMKVLITVFLLALLYHINILVTAFLKPSDIRNHLGSRTPYRFKSNKNDSRIRYPNCKDYKIWMMVRHGTRLPNIKDITAARNLTELKSVVLLQHKYGKGQLNKAQLKQLEDWTTKINEDEEKFLTLEGQDEMILLAERMQKRFPNAIKQKYNNKTFLFRYTATQRTQQSARYFANGLFERRDAQEVIFAPATKVDRVLRFYKHCDRWQMQVKRNPDTYKEQELYGISREMNETLKSVSKRLGLDVVLELETVNAMYKLCGYETAWNKHHMSPWCYAFDDKTIKPLEYYHDLKTYWLDGYGYELTYRQACVSIKHMLDSFSNEEAPRSTFLFTHSGAVLKLLTFLGLYKPKFPLLGTHRAEDRRWRISEIDTFAANVAFVLFKCKGGDRILTLHQEKIVKLPMCSEELCPLKTLTDYFHDTIATCDYDNMCSLDRNDDAIPVDKTSFNITVSKHLID